MTETLPTFADVVAARARIGPRIVRTPLVRTAAIDRMLGARVLFKAEPLQRTGSFKIRGAFNRLLQIGPDDARRGVIAWSSGNHAQGIAAAAAELNMPAVIVMPADAPAIKRAATAALGAEIVSYHRLHEDREAISFQIARQRGLTVVPAYDDPIIIAGQGTLGLELAEQAAELGIALDEVLVPVSGGGLLAGVGLALAARMPAAAVIGVEPAGFDDHRRTFETGAPQRNATLGPGLCDALLAPTPGRITWRLNRAHARGFRAVDDDAVKAAMAMAFEHLKLVVEPGGAVGLAALIAARRERGPLAGDRTMAVVLSGGNVDSDVYTACVCDVRNAIKAI
ncbi:MAG: threonine/serine dehydratase [Rhodospirillaceae bacterium]|nr:threonine/serine dehydratase [Rhodospirillaceae bacterium]